MSKSASRIAFEAWWKDRDPERIGDTNAILAWITWRTAWQACEAAAGRVTVEAKPVNNCLYLKNLIGRLIEDADPNADPPDLVTHLALMLEAANAISDKPMPMKPGTGPDHPDWGKVQGQEDAHYSAELAARRERDAKTPIERLEWRLDQQQVTIDELKERVEALEFGDDLATPDDAAPVDAPAPGGLPKEGEQR
jgi:hypothetical protein